MKQVNEKNFEEEVLKYEGLVLVDFFTNWCPPCKMLSPVLEELSKDDKLKAKIVKIDVDENNKIATEYKIYSVPTMLYFKSGKVVEKVIGYEDKEAIIKRIKELSKKVGY